MPKKAIFIAIRYFNVKSVTQLTIITHMVLFDLTDIYNGYNN